MAVLITAGGRILLANGRARNAVGTVTPPDEGPPPADNGSGGATATTFTNDRIYQRVGTSKAVPVSATVTGADGVVEMRVVDLEGVGMMSWAAIGTSSGGTVSGTLTVPQGGWYKLQTRKASNRGAVSTSTNKFGVGAGFVMAGQSNMVFLWASGRQTYPDYPLSASTVRGIQIGAGKGVYGRIGNYDDTFPPSTSFGNGGSGYSTVNSGVTDGGDGMVYFANLLTAALGVPVFFVMSAVGGTEIEAWQPGQVHWNNTMTLLDIAGGDCEGMFWYQGENNAGNSQAAYGAKISPIHQGMLTKTGRTTANFAFGMVTLGPTGNYGAEGTAGPIRAAQIAYLSNPGVFLAGVAGDRSSPAGDQVHIYPDSQIVMGHRYAKSLLAYYAGTPKPGPRITGATRSGAVVTVEIAGGTGALKDGAGGSGANLKGFRVFDGASLMTISSTAISGNTVVLTLSATPSGTVTLDHGMPNLPYGVSEPPANTILYDSDTVTYAHPSLPLAAVGLPLQPCAAITVTGA